MACNQTLSGLVRDCSPSMGGIVEVYAANRDEVGAITISDDKISAIETGAKKFKKYSFARNTGSMTSNYQISPENGTRFVATDLVLVFNRMETTKRVEMTALAQNDLVLVVKDANGKYWLLGKDEPVRATAGDGLTGTARADRNGYSITLQDNSHEMPYEVDEALAAGLVG
jgi:hypothetical protein